MLFLPVYPEKHLGLACDTIGTSTIIPPSDEIWDGLGTGPLSACEPEASLGG